MKVIFSILAGLLCYNVFATEITFQSGHNQATLIELFTSEGCSSCPPAEAWLNKYRHSEQLWSKIVPMAFHVDYWNYLGWKDTFSDPDWTRRQSQYHRQGKLKTIYTPGFVINGQEWRGFFRKKSIISDQKTVGRLTIQLNGDRVTARFDSKDFTNLPLQLNLAVLGADLTTQVKSGENKGRQLKHDFVVLGMNNTISTTPLWQTKLPSYNTRLTQQLALVAWVETIHSDKTLEYVQATGAWISTE